MDGHSRADATPLLNTSICAAKSIQQVLSKCCLQSVRWSQTIQGVDMTLHRLPMSLSCGQERSCSLDISAAMRLFDGRKTLCASDLELICILHSVLHMRVVGCLCTCPCLHNSPSWIRKANCPTCSNAKEPHIAVCTAVHSLELRVWQKSHWFNIHQRLSCSLSLMLSLSLAWSMVFEITHHPFPFLSQCHAGEAQVDYWLVVLLGIRRLFQQHSAALCASATECQQQMRTLIEHREREQMSAKGRLSARYAITSVFPCPVGALTRTVPLL